MSSTALDVDSQERAPSSELSVLDLAHYTLETLRKDAELVLFRGFRNVWEEGSRPTILVRAPVSNAPVPATSRSLQAEYELRSELDPAHVIRPLSMVQVQGRPMLILEDPQGTPLDLLLNGATDVEPFLRLAIRITAALAHVHSRGFAHKDVKPANILVNTTRDQAWLMGLGLASRQPRERQSGTSAQHLSGTLAYMAPEQTGRMNRSIDSRSDLYALGVTFYEMLTGALPFAVSDPMELVHCHLAKKPTAPCEKVKSVPRAVSRITEKLLAKMAEERYQTAAGVEADLRRCLTDWETQHRIDEFPLGEYDLPDRLLIPEKLYGREAAMKELLAAFDRAATGSKAELLLVSGYSGIGKSSVVNELHKLLVPRHCLFTSGKYDQYKRDIPYATLAQAYQNLVQQLLGMSQADLAPWQEALRDALGENGRLIIDLVPELELVIGPQPPVPELPPHDARRRFQLIIRRFMGVFAQSSRPLVVFLDDLQWLDAATLDLLEDLLAGPDLQHLLLIGAYRANEVTSAHPLRQKLDAIETAGTKVREITLAPLGPTQLNQLISEALRCAPERAAPLAQLVHERTGGNPFFANRFIVSLAEEGMLTFSHDKKGWVWNIPRIHAKGYTDNLVDLMVGELARLPPATQKILQQLACLGNAAEVSTLSQVCRIIETKIHRLLHPAVRSDLLERRQDSYHFVHDRIQEAAYLLVPECLRPAEHLRIGRLLAANTPPERREESIYEIVNQLNRGADLIYSDPERERLADLNLTAGKRAKTSTAYSSALRYLAAAGALLAGTSWDRCPALTFAVELNRAECEFLTGDLASAEQRLSRLAARASSLVDQAAVACLRAALEITLARADRAVTICVEYLHAAGIACPAHPTDADVREEYERLWLQLDGRPIEALCDLPLMQDPNWRATMEVLTELSAPAYFLNANLWCLVLLRMANLSAEHGNCDGSSYAYGFLNTVLGGRFGNYPAGRRFGDLGLNLVEKRGLSRFKARVYLACGCAVIPWARPIREAVSFLRRSAEAALEVGDQTYATYAPCNLISNRLTSADSLSDVQRDAENALAFSQRAGFGPCVDIVLTQLGFIRSARGLTREFGAFFDTAAEEDQFDQHIGCNPSFVGCWYWIRKLQIHFYAGNYPQANSAAAKAQPLLRGTSGLFEESDYSFFAALALAAASRSATPEQRRDQSDALREHHERLTLWAEHCPENFAARAALVGAEIARLEGRELDAERLYHRAIQSAHAQDFCQNEGLAYELAAQFYAARGLDAFADLYFRKARDCYKKWGAEAKVRQLSERHPILRDNAPGIDSTNTSTASVERLELATVLKVAQAVSGEMNLNRLLENLMRAAIENAGAERGLLIALRNDELQVQAQATASGPEVTVELRGNEPSQAAFPQSLVRYVMRTRELVILEDAASQNLFSADPYLAGHRIRSVLCSPLATRGNLIGVLYLENNLVTHAFAPERIALLKVLASQAAMSLENTRLYRDLANREAQVRRLVDANIVGIFIWDLDGALLEANDALLQMVGYERKDLASGQLRWTDWAAPQWHGSDLQQRAAEIQRTGHLEPFEWEYIRKDGSRVPVLVGAAIFEGERQGVAFVLDLTVRKRAEQALRQGQAYLSESQRLTHTGSWAFDLRSRKVVYWSEEMFRIYGRDPHREGLPTYDELLRYVHPDDRERFQAAGAQGRDNTEVTIDYRIVTDNGTVRQVHSARIPMFDKTGEQIETVGTLVDVTDRRRSEHRALVQQRIHHILTEVATIEEALPKVLQAVCEDPGWDLGMVWRNDGQVDVLRCTSFWCKPSVNAAQFEAASRAREIRLGSGLPGRVWACRLPVFIPSIADDPEFHDSHIAARERLHAACAFPILFGTEVLGVVELVSRETREPLADLMVIVGGQLGQYIERKRAENALQLAQAELAHVTRVMTMGQLAASIAHEVNQPLGAIVTSAAAGTRWLASEPPQLAKVRRTLERISNDGKRAAEVIRRIRALMKRQAPRKEWLDINEMISEVITLLQYQLRRSDIRLETRLDPALHQVRGDRVQLQQVLLNLTINAIEAMGSIKERPRELTIVSVSDEPDTVAVEVRDSGIGLDPKHAPHLFEPFYTTKDEGLGVGLSISHSIIEAHGGQLSAADNAPHGTVFRFALPVDEQRS